MSLCAITLVALLPALVVWGSGIDLDGNTSMAGDESCAALQVDRKSDLSPVPLQCRDTVSNCAYYVDMGYCTRDDGANVREQCKFSCGLCCTDRDSNCAYYAKEGWCTGELSGNVREKCKLSCGLCEYSVSKQYSVSRQCITCRGLYSRHCRRRRRCR